MEAGKTAEETLAPLVARLDVPDHWRIVLVIPRQRQGIHGAQERQAFASLAAHGSDLDGTDALCRLVLLGLLPLLQAGDCDLFGEVLYDFNQRVGAAFAPVQGGIYASEGIAAVVSFVRGEGVKGVGQSSWGPTVFAVVPDEEKATALVARLQAHFGTAFADFRVTRARRPAAREIRAGQ